jgi:phage replication initiation protein
MYHHTISDSSSHCQGVPGVPHMVPGLAGSMCGTPASSSTGPVTEMPPSNDKGAEITLRPSCNRVLIDFLAVTFKKVTDPMTAIEYCGLDPGLFIDTSIGGMGYKRSFRLDNIVGFYDGNDGMGCHISMTGQGCRQYEALTGNKPFMWLYFIKDLLLQGASFTRLDIALDNVDGRLSLDYLRQAVKHKTIRTRFKNYKLYSEGSLSRSVADWHSETIQFGTTSSRILIQFYNKAVEQEKKHDLTPGSLGTWARCEVRLFKERAHEAACQIYDYLRKAEKIDPRIFSILASGIIMNYICVIDIENDTNISRCKAASWWTRWLVRTRKIKLTTAEAPKYIEPMMQHMEKQYAATFAMFKEHLGVVRFSEFMRKLLIDGRCKMAKRHIKILDRSRHVPLSELPF